MMTFMCGQIVATGMGVDKLNMSSLIVFIIYGTLMFCMTILFYNIFVGIATYEIRQILHNSNIEITLTKIEYIFRLEKRFGCSRAFKWLDNGIKLIERFFWKKSFVKFRKSRKQRVGKGKELIISMIFS
jgi:hypothetical protein